MLATHVQRRGQQVGIGHVLVLAATAVIGGEAIAAAGAEADLEFADGAGRQTQSAGDVVGGVALGEAIPDELALGKRYSPRHGKPSWQKPGKGTHK
jgi:hypothetical protein